MKNQKEKQAQPEVDPDELIEPGKPSVDPEQYYKLSGMFEIFKSNGKTIRFTHSLDSMKRQQEEMWSEYLQKYKEEAGKYGNQINDSDIESARIIFIKNEVDLFSGYLTGSSSRNDKIEIQKYLIELKKELEPVTIEKDKPNIKYFSWTGTSAQLTALWQALIHDDYIHPQTDYKAFTAIFSGKQIGSSPLRVTWIKKAQRSKSIAKNAVIALFDILANANKIPMGETINRAKLFKMLEACFCDEAGDPLTFEHSHCKISPISAGTLQQIISLL